MNPAPFFIIQLLWFLVAWAAVAVLLVEPRLRGCSSDDALSVWIAPQLFRVLGVGLLVPNLSPGMPASFAVPTAVGDSLTAVLALIALTALQRRWRTADITAWAVTIVGSLDLMLALPHAASIEAARYMTAQWYVPVLCVPLMIVCHAMAARQLMRARREGRVVVSS